MHWKIGSAPVGGLIELVEFDDRRDLAWVGITGVTMRGRIRLRDAGRRQTKVTFRLSYQAPGGIWGYSPTAWPSARSAGRGRQPKTTRSARRVRR